MQLPRRYLLNEKMAKYGLHGRITWADPASGPSGTAKSGRRCTDLPDDDTDREGLCGTARVRHAAGAAGSVASGRPADRIAADPVAPEGGIGRPMGETRTGLRRLSDRR